MSDTCTLSLQAKFLEMKNNFSGALELINQVCTNTGGQFTVLYDGLPVPSIQIQLNLSTMAILGTEKSGHCGEEAIMGR